ncbi:SPOR domain-containing protein [Dongia soli]|uniref:SPOR domain-containing protein n=1 Tax=Dongia soli TaxID=600628 RepID=A0ABU5E951_9PROT|nr:SPOR domain-containing protein [Dongia soli]MDY0882381.1 SPOR domain-containing protein [Dongia soli]
MAVDLRWTAKARAFLLAGLFSSFSLNVAVADMAEAQAATASGDYAAADQALRPLAAAGRVDAQYQLAKLALDGRDVGLKPDQAMSLLVQAAAQGNGPAQARLGLAYAKGERVTQNDLAAYQWLSRASISPDLSDIERSVVTTNRTVILNRLAPTLAAGVDLNKAAAAQAPLPPKPEPAGSIAAVPLFSETTPAPQTHADDAESLAAESNEGDRAKDERDKAPVVEPAPSMQVSAGKTVTPTKPAALPSVPASAKSYQLQIASLSDATAAEAERKRLVHRHAKLLGGLTVEVLAINVADKGIRHRIVAGPFDDKRSAQQRCKQFKAAGQDCLVAGVAHAIQAQN